MKIINLICLLIHLVTLLTWYINTCFIDSTGFTSSNNIQILLYIAFIILRPDTTAVVNRKNNSVDLLELIIPNVCRNTMDIICSLMNVTILRPTTKNIISMLYPLRLGHQRDLIVDKISSQLQILTYLAP